MKKEYLYIFSNTERNGILKIGRTDKHPESRAEQLTKQTGVLGKFKVEWYKEVPNSEIAEKIVHYKLKDHHYEKEYFKIDIDSAVEKIESELISFFGDELEKNKELSKEDIQNKINDLSILLKKSSTTDKQFIRNSIKALELVLKSKKFDTND